MSFLNYSGTFEELLSQEMSYSKLIASITGSLATAGLYALPSTIGLEECRKWFALYKYKEEIPVHPNVLQRLKDVMQDLGLTEDEKNKIKPFSSVGYDTWHLGTTALSYGAILGIGSNLEYIDVPAINIEEMSILGEPVNWNRDDAQMFLKSCMLSEQAQKYLFARNILKIKSMSLDYEATILHASVFSVCGANILLTEYLPPSKYSRIVRAFVRLATVFAGYFMWGLLYDRHDDEINKKNDEEISKLGVLYITGGKEYYEKYLDRNLSFRTLLPMGYLYVQENGEARTLVRWKSPLLRERIQFFSSKLEKETAHA